jgi:hypothetical protein
MPLLRRWSARLAEAQEVLVRFQGVAPCSASHAASLRHASVAPRQSSRFLPGSVLVRVQPEARLRVRPTGEVPAPRAEPGEFDSHDPLHARAVQRLNAGVTCRRSLVRSQPRARPSHVVFFQRQGPRFLTPGNTGSTPVHDTLPTPSSNGSGSEITNLRMVVRVHPESLCFILGRDLGSHGSPKHISGVRFLDGLRTWQAAHLVVGSVSYAERAGFDSLACYRPSTLASSSPGGDGSLTYCRRRVRFPGSLPRVPLAQWQVLSPDKRPTKVRLLHGTLSSS